MFEQLHNLHQFILKLLKGDVLRYLGIKKLNTGEGGPSTLFQVSWWLQRGKLCRYNVLLRCLEEDCDIREVGGDY